MMPLSNIPPYDEIYLGQDTAPMERVLDNLELFQNNPSRIPENISEAFKSWTIDEVQWTHDQAQWESAIQSAAQRVRLFKSRAPDASLIISKNRGHSKRSQRRNTCVCTGGWRTPIQFQPYTRRY